MKLRRFRVDRCVTSSQQSRGCSIHEGARACGSQARIRRSFSTSCFNSRTDSRAHNLYPSQWTKISEAVDRSELDCRDRWRELRDAPTRESGPWSQEETAALEAAVKKACEVAGKDPIKDGVPWDAVVDLMQRKRTALQCRKKW